MKKYYKCTSNEQRRAVLAALFALGYVWHKEYNPTHTPEEVEEMYSFEYYPTLILNTRTGSIAGNCSETSVSLEQLLVPYVSELEPIEVHVGAYIAVIRANDAMIGVGCQSINIFTVREIVAAWERLNPETPM